jgi:hypothetical protein
LAIIPADNQRANSRNLSQIDMPHFAADAGLDRFCRLLDKIRQYPMRVNGLVEF